MIFDRLYYRAYVYFTGLLSFTGQMEHRPETPPTIMLSLILVAWVMASLLVMEFFGYVAFGQGRLVSSAHGENYVIVFLLSFMLFCYLYFVNSGRWKKILKDYGQSGARYCPYCDRAVDLVCALPFALILILVFF